MLKNSTHVQNSDKKFRQNIKQFSFNYFIEEKNIPNKHLLSVSTGNRTSH